MPCPSCGAVLAEPARFCPACGASRDGRGPLERARALVEATSLISAGAARDLDQVLDAIAAQAARLLAADDVQLHLAAPDRPGSLVRRDQSRLRADAARPPAGDVYQPSAFVREAIALRGPLFSADFQHDPRVHPADRALFPTVAATLVVPLFAPSLAQPPVGDPPSSPPAGASPAAPVPSPIATRTPATPPSPGGAAPTSSRPGETAPSSAPALSSPSTNNLGEPLVQSGEAPPEDELVGVLRLRWTRPIDLDAEDIAAAQAVARHAAIAVRTSRAVEAEREARRRADELLAQAQRLRGRAEANEARLATIVEHLPCGILILDAAGKVVMVNEAVGRVVGSVPSGLEPLTAQADAIALRDPRDGRPFTLRRDPIGRALAGAVVEAQEVLFRRPGETLDRRAQLSAAPMRDREGGVRGAIVVLTEVTELHAAIAERARLDGAVKTARLITHELNNKLTAITANADLLLSDIEGEALQFAEEIMRGADDAAAIVARLNQIVRFEETDLGLGEPVLDLRAATTS